MITGFNTDVRHRDVVFHVQTEDKGTGNPCIESLVYVGGQILARKRAGYRSLLDGDAASKAVAELMESQHRSMIEEIRAGKMDEKLAAIKGPVAAKPAAQEVALPVPAAPPAAKPAPAPAEPPAAPPIDASTAVPQKMPPLPKKPEPASPRRESAAAPAMDASTAAPRKMPGPAKGTKPARKPAKPTAAPPSGRKGKAPKRVSSDDRSLDQVILDYLEMESGQEKLVLTMDRKAGELVAGGEATLLFRAKSSIDADPIGETKITVRLISTGDEPQVLGEGRTDDRGELELTISIPDLRTGSCALIISAESSIGYTEVRHLI